MCDYEKGELNQKIKEGYDFHVKHEHHMWNYMHYLTYLEYKGVDDLS
jgi:hypothetical protein